MVVTVSVPRWLTAAQARKEVRSLIQHQAFWGHRQSGPWMSLSERDWEICESNFKLRRIGPVRGA